jgi:hypothetical protein
LRTWFRGHRKPMRSPAHLPLTTNPHGPSYTWSHVLSWRNNSADIRGMPNQAGSSQLAGFPMRAGRTRNLTRPASPSAEAAVRANAADQAIGDVNDVFSIPCANS